MRTKTAVENAGRELAQAPLELEPAAVLPVQLGSAFVRGATQQPEKRLMLAVLEDAVTVFLREAVREPGQTSRDYDETRAWIWSDEVVWPFSFVNICRTLGLEPSAIRRGLATWRQRQLALAPEHRVRVRSPFRRMNGTRTKTRSHAPGLKLAVA
jgi:hypothetical protein